MTTIGILDLKLIFVTIAFFIFTYQAEVNHSSDEFTISVERTFNATKCELYHVVTTPHLFNKWVDWILYLMPADHKPLKIGKAFKVILDDRIILFKVIEFEKGSYLAVESNFLLRPRLEIHFFETLPSSLLSSSMSFWSSSSSSMSSSLSSKLPSSSESSSTSSSAHSLKHPNESTIILNDDDMVEYKGFPLSRLHIRLIFLRSSVLFQIEQQREYVISTRRNLAFILPKHWNETTDNIWLSIGNPTLRHKVYSAIFDNRVEINDIFNFRGVQYGSVKIFAVLPLAMTSKIKCIFKLESDITWEEDATEAYPIHEHFDMKFSAYTINCPLIATKKQKFVKLPKWVAIGYDSNPETFLIPIFIAINYPKYGEIFSQPYKNLSVCIGPLQNVYSNVLRLVEFIEVNRMLGVEKFYFYKLSTTEDTKTALDYYIKAGIIEVLSWNFYGYRFEEEVRYSGIFVTLNECVYRSTFIDGFKYTAIIDLDEILIPFHHNTLIEYLAEMDDGKTNSFIFRGVFLHRYHKNDSSIVPEIIRNKFLYTQVKIQRTNNPFPTRNRSKYIVRGEMAIELGNHHIWRGVRGTTEKTLPTEDALLFHYRTKCVTYSCDAPLIVDFHARRFGALLWTKVDQVCGDIFKDDGKCPLVEVE